MQQDVTWRGSRFGAGVWGEFGVCSVPFGLVAALGHVAALNYGPGSHGRLGGVDDLSRGRRRRVAPDDLARGRRIWLGLDVAGLHHGLDHGRPWTTGGAFASWAWRFFSFSSMSIDWRLLLMKATTLHAMQLPTTMRTMKTMANASALVVLSYLSSLETSMSSQGNAAEPEGSPGDVARRSAVSYEESASASSQRHTLLLCS